MIDKREHFKRGTLRNIILYVLNNGPKGVYEIKKSIKEISMGFYTPSTGVIYPNLRSLIREGMIEERSLEGKKKYYITKNGEKYLKENMQKWKNSIELKRKKFEKIEEIGVILRKITDQIISMDDESLEKNRKKIIEILEDAFKKIKEI